MTRPASLDDTPIYDLYVANRAAAALAVGVRLDLFAQLEAEPASAAEAAARFELSERGAEALLVALHAARLLDRDAEERYVPTPAAAAYLVEGREGWLGGLIDLEFESFLSPAGLLAALQRGRATVYGDDEMWATHAADPDKARQFTAAMHSISSRPAAALAERIDLRSASRLLDVGAGSGVYSAAALARYEHLEAVLIESAAVAPLAAETLAGEGLAGRARVVVADMFEDEWPGDCDVVLFSQILHDWPRGKCVRLLRRAFEALPGSGRVLVSEKLLRDDKGGPLANALVSLDMLFWTEGRQYSAAEIVGMLTEAGFVDPEVTPSVGYWSIVSAVRTPTAR